MKFFSAKIVLVLSFHFWQPSPTVHCHQPSTGIISPLLLSHDDKPEEKTRRAIIQFHSLQLRDEINPQEKLIPHLRSKTNLIKKRFITFLSSRQDIKLNASQVEFFWINQSALIEGDTQLFQTLSENPDIAFIGPDRRFELSNSKDTLIETNWGTKSTYGIRQVNAHRVWKEHGLTGKGVKVGILDTGWSSHPELQSKILASKDFISKYPDNQPNDDHGHGSHCMGIIAGGDSSGEAIGVAPGAQFLVAKIFSDLGYTHESIILRAMQWISDPDNNPATDDFPRVVNSSWGHPRGSDKEEKLLWDALISWRKLGIIPIFAAGNEGPENETISSPASFPHVVAVGAANRWRFVHKTSSRGPVRWGGDQFTKPDLIAPGVAIQSIDHNGGYTKKTGTSMAAPFVTGIVALMLQARPLITADRVIKLLQKSSSIGFDEVGSQKYGYGNANAQYALALLFNENQLTLKVNCGNQIAKVVVKPLNLEYETNSNGELVISLPSGKFDLEISAFGHKPETLSLKLGRHDYLKEELTLKPAPLYPIVLDIFSPEEVLIDAEIEIVNSPLKPMQTTDGSLKIDLPKGEFHIIARARGYLPLRDKFKIKKEANLTFHLKHLPSVLIIDDDYANDSIETYKKALSTNELSFISLKKDNEIEKSAMMSFERIIWYTGSSGLGTLNPRDRAFIEDYVNNGGQMLLTGQDIGYEIGQSQFYRHWLGVEFIKDHEETTRVFASNQELNLAPDDNIHYPRSFDVMKIISENTRVFCNYDTGSVAGIELQTGNGKLVYLGFGFEAISGETVRSEFLEHVMKNLEPTMESRMAKIKWAYQNDQFLLSMLIREFKRLPVEDRLASRNWIMQQESKTPFKALLALDLYQED